MCCRVCQNFLSFVRIIIFYCMSLPHLFMHSSIHKHFSYFYPVAVINNAVMYTIALQDSILNSFGSIQRSGVAGSYGILCLIFWGNMLLLSIEDTSFYMPNNIGQGFQFLHPHQQLLFYGFVLFFVLFDSSHPGRHEVMSHCSFDLHFLND